MTIVDIAVDDSRGEETTKKWGDRKMKPAGISRSRMTPSQAVHFRPYFFVIHFFVVDFSVTTRPRGAAPKAHWGGSPPFCICILHFLLCILRAFITPPRTRLT
jgi:hypothetical protein